MNNYEIADHFSLLSKLMDIHGENSFKSKSYSNAAFNIERLPAEITGMSDAELFGIRGIGESTGKKIRELVATGKLYQLEEMLAVTPAGILDMLQIKGLGPKKIAVIWTELGIESLGELEYACNENRLVALKGFGAKTQEGVLQNIVYFKQNLGFHLWAEVEKVAESLTTRLQKGYPDNLFSLTGDIRRQNETVEFIELVTDLDKEILVKEFENIPDAVVEEEPNGRLLVRIPGQPRVRFHLTDRPHFHHTLFMTTGSDEFMSAFTGSHKVPETPVSEPAIFEHNGLAYVPAMLRETAGILDIAASHSLKELIKTH